MDSKLSAISAHLVEGPLILSIDIGTSALKILLFDNLGRAVDGHQYRREVTLRTSQDRASEVAPEELLDIVWQEIDLVLSGFDSLMPKRLYEMLIKDGK